eukprot:m.900901 g.900901  ORF g.900901 m.900901 type:complete len:597 (-) comp23686_c1_seq7:491-2281(-)
MERLLNRVLEHIPSTMTFKPWQRTPQRTQSSEDHTEPQNAVHAEPPPRYDEHPLPYASDMPRARLRNRSSCSDNAFDEDNTGNPQGMLLTILEIIVEMIRYYCVWIREFFLPGYSAKRTFSRNIIAAKSYTEWKTWAGKLDDENGAQAWKMQYESTEYDYRLVHERLEDLRRARKNDNWTHSAYILRSTLDRNLGGMRSPALFEKSLLGTKDLIKQYIDEVVYHLNYIADNNIAGLDMPRKIAMFTQMRAGFGRSALLLSGGAGLGVHHFGVIKALHEAHLLPRIISGSSAGALVGSLICTTPDDELDALLDGTTPALKSHHIISRDRDRLPMQEMIMRYLTHGTIADIDVLKECCRINLGDMTFQEAYNKTGRILNITVNSRTDHGIPRLLNYLTSPDVVIWTAACASCALFHIFEEVEVLCKDKEGNLVTLGPPGTKWSDGSVESDLPMTRLRELFNVNYFIVSQVNPHVVPLLYSMSNREPRFPLLIRLLLGETRLRLRQLISVGAWRGRCRQLLGMLTQKYTGDVTIVPYISYKGYIDILANPTPPIYHRALMNGERAAWKKLSMIKTNCKIELALEKIVARLRGSEMWSES